MPRLLQVLVVAMAGLVVGGAAAWLLKPAEIRHAGAAIEEPTLITEAADKPREDTQSLPSPPSEIPAEADTEPESPPAEVVLGDGTITGTVTFADGKPCAGLPLLAEHLPTFLTAAAQSRMTVSRASRNAHFERVLQQLDAATLHSTTGPDGRFTINGVGEGKYRLSSADSELTFGLKTCDAGDDLTIIVSRTLFVEFDVRQEGTPLDEAHSLWFTGGETNILPSPSNWWRGRRYPIQSGKWTVTIRNGPGDMMRDLWSVDHEFEVPVDGLNAPVVVELKPLAALVVSRTHDSPYYEQLGIYAHPTDTLPEGNEMTAREVWTRAGMSNTFTNPAAFRDLTPGRYTLFAMVGTIHVLATKEVQYEGGHQHVEFELPPLQREDHIVLRVYDPDDKPLDGVKVSMFMERAGSTWNRPYVARGNGEYWVCRVDPSAFYYDGVHGTEFRIQATHPAFGSRVLAFPFDQRDELVLRFGLQSKLTVHLENLPQDSGRLELTAVPTGTDESAAFEPMAGWPTLANAARERAEFDLASGPVTVLLRVKPDRSSGTVHMLERRRIELQPGENELRIRVPDFCALNVTAPAELNLTYMTLRARGMTWSASPDAEGRFKFTEIPEGEYELVAIPGAMTVRLPAMTDVVFLPQPYNALRIRWLDSAGILAAAGLEVGDIVRSVNGETLYGDSAALREKFLKAGETGRISLSVQRDGRQFTVNGDPARWEKLPTWVVEAALVP